MESKADNAQQYSWSNSFRVSKVPQDNAYAIPDDIHVSTETIHLTTTGTDDEPSGFGNT
jgi:hypothetical protein